MSKQNKNVIQAMYYSDFWIKLSRKVLNEVLYENIIDNLNSGNLDKGYLSNIFNEDEKASKDEVISLINNVSKIPNADRYKEGVKLTEEYYNDLNENMNLENIESEVNIKYGIVTKRSKLKIFPTRDRIYNVPNTYELDRFMESAVYIGEPCIIYADSKDKEWYFCKTYNSQGWVEASDVAIGEKSEVEDFSKAKDFIVVTGRKILLGYNPFIESLSEESIDMGVKLPIEKEWGFEDTVYDMHTEGNYVVKYPTRDVRGRLKFTNILIPYGEDVNEGYLKCTRKNVLKQAFKFQGERYGWGGEFEGRDCSSMIVDIFRVFGINFPRNTGEQLNKSLGKTIYFDENISINKKLSIIDGLKPGSLIYLNGHVAMIVGKYKGRIYIIHDVIGVNVEEDGRLIYLPIRGVTVSSLNDIYTSSKKNYMDEVIGVKDIFQYKNE